MQHDQGHDEAAQVVHGGQPMILPHAPRSDLKARKLDASHRPVGACFVSVAAGRRRRFSDIYLLRDGERVVHLDPKIADRAFQLGVAQQELNRPKIADTAVNQGDLGPPKRVGAI